MGKASQYLLILSVIIAVFYVLGLVGGDGGLIALVLDWANIENSYLWTGIFVFTMTAFAALSAIGVGFFTNIKLEQVPNALVTIALMPYFIAIVDIGLVIKTQLDTALGSSIGTTATLLVCGPLAVFAVFTLYEWWRLKD